MGRNYGGDRVRKKGRGGGRGEEGGGGRRQREKKREERELPAVISGYALGDSFVIQVSRQSSFMSERGCIKKGMEYLGVSH